MYWEQVSSFAKGCKKAKTGRFYFKTAKQGMYCVFYRYTREYYGISYRKRQASLVLIQAMPMATSVIIFGIEDTFFYPLQCVNGGI